jgi:hypothetical protein
MRKFTWPLLLLPAISLLLTVGCDTADDDDSGGEDVFIPYIVEASPSAQGDETNFFYQADLWVEFDRPPETVTVTLTDAAGSALAGTQTSDTPGRVFTFDPTDDLTPSTSYTMSVAWTPTEGGAANIPFQTGAHGTEIATPEDMIGSVYNIDLAGATFVEPPGVGAIIGSQLDGIAILFTPTDESDFANNEMHILGALGAEEGGNVTQELCTETLAFTYGPDSIYGTDDDVAATFNNPRMEVGPTDLPLSIQGITAVIQNLIITGVFAPTLEDMMGGTFGGSIDTRPLAPELDPDGGEGAICDLVWETVGVECEECGGDNPGQFCLTVLAEDIVANEVPGLELTPYTCDVLIQMAIDTGECAEEAADFDEDGDGTYELCPAYVP